MKKVALWVSEPYSGDELFNENSPLNRDNCLVPAQLLKNELGKMGWECHTQDIYKDNKSTPTIVLFGDIPLLPVDMLLDNWKSRVQKWVILQECEVIMTHNWEVNRHAQFDKIFTWHDDLVDGRKYFKLNFTNLFPRNISNGLYRKEKLLTLIAQNKKAKHPLELYSKRLEAIRWFEKYHPNEFDLYGIGWDEYTFEGIRPVRALNKLRLFRKLFAGHFPSYKGRIERKKPVLEKYKFAICFENAKDIPGYITEKIFDCFFAGCIPIYWGANNVTDHIPKKCFIDKRDFDSYEKLYEFIKGMDDITYQRYINNVQEYLNSPMSYEFTAECFAKTIINGLVNE